MIVTVEVTQDDIDHGVRGECVIAFDHGRPVQPFAFALEIPDDVLARLRGAA